MATQRQPLPEMLACSCAQVLFPEISDAIADDPEWPATVNVAGFRFLLDPPPAEKRRHEDAHQVQKAEHAPKWVPAWFPPEVRAFLGNRRFWEAYRLHHHQHGFLGNPFEVAARKAQARLVVDDDESPTPVE